MVAQGQYHGGQGPVPWWPKAGTKPLTALRWLGVRGPIPQLAGEQGPYPAGPWVALGERLGQEHWVAHGVDKWDWAIRSPA